jgi:hypothetical protein
MKYPENSRQSGVALVVTMIVMAVMAVVAVAFMQGASSDRAAANSLVGNYQALLVAEAAMECAAGEVGRLLCGGGTGTANATYGYHDSATVWQNIGGAASNEATVLYIRATATDLTQGARPGDSNVVFLARPLVSGITNTIPGLSPGIVNVADVGTVLPANGPDMVNLNATNEFTPEPWIGFRSTTNNGAPVIAARWVYVGQNLGPTNATNPPMARYAFWVEDESFKLNVNVATNGARGTNAGAGPQQLTTDGTLGASQNLSGYVGRTGNMLADRARFGGNGFPSVGTAALALGLEGSTNLAAWRFLTTVHSAGLNLSRGGFRRFNINSIVADPDVRRSLDRVISAITNSNSAPNFGQRFYRLTPGVGVNAANVVTTNHAAIYLNKIAANIVDYLDEDDQPTIVNNDDGFTLRTGKPEFGIEPLGGGTIGSNAVAAMGVENVPRLQEYALHCRIRRLEPIGYNSSSPQLNPVANYRISIDHYFEFWNPGTRDITINGAFLKIYDQPRFGDNITGPLATEGRPFEVPVDGITFPAGRVTVLTTAPEAELNEALVPAANRANIVHLDTAVANRIFEGETRDWSSGAAFGGNGFNRYFKISLKSRSTSNTDYESAMLLGNTNGILESFVGLPIVRSNATAAVPSVHFVASSAAAASVVGETPDKFSLGNQYYAVAGSLRGNSTTSASPSSTEGDPRALNEQLEFHIYNSDASHDQTRFFSANLNNGSVPAQSTFGAPNTNFVRPTNWVDSSSTAAGSANAPLFVGNGALQSIGDLGHVTDPARLPGTNGVLATPPFSRGGGRTLRIGQPEHERWYDGNQTNASRTWTSWRLADIFGVSDAIKVSGLINPNGMLRDGGAAFRAALHGMTMLPSPDGSTNTANRAVNVTNVVASTLARMTNLIGSGLPTGAINPFWERGEVSQLPLFNSGTTLAGVNMSNSFDRGREEVVRRSIEMITTRGSVFTVYVLGQALQATRFATNVIGTARLKITYEIIPEFATPVSDSFDPSVNASVAARFREPTNYTRRVLSVSYE